MKRFSKYHPGGMCSVQWPLETLVQWITTDVQITWKTVDKSAYNLIHYLLWVGCGKKDILLFCNLPEWANQWEYKLVSL